MEIIMAELALWLESAPRAQGGGGGGQDWPRRPLLPKVKGYRVFYYWFCLLSSVFKMFQVNNNNKKSGFYLVLVDGKGHGTTFPDGRKSE